MKGIVLRIELERKKEIYNQHRKHVEFEQSFRPKSPQHYADHKIMKLKAL